ncbi:MAG: hypothetical protein C00003105_01603 [ANME-2 cluster archaeon HR1]|nr:MAG: hypothetical protein C00003105_01603 [ANME-2 cluster archaeon HR1]
MSLRIVSGVLLPKPGHRVDDSATIELKSNTIKSDTSIAELDDECEWGGGSHYDKEPCKAVSIRYFDGKPDSINLTDTFIEHDSIEHARVKIHWKCVGGEIKEITYFFAGEE